MVSSNDNVRRMSVTYDNDAWSMCECGSYGVRPKKAMIPLFRCFELHYPQPQPWRIVHLRSAMRSLLISALQMKRGDLQSVLNDPKHKTPIGPLGLSSVRPLGLTPTLKQNQNSYLFSKFLPCDYDRESTVAPTGLSGLGPWRTIYAPSLRRSPAWGPRTRA